MTAAGGRRPAASAARAGRLAAWALVLLPAFPPPHRPAQDAGLALGSTPPAAVVQDLDGRPVDLSRLYVGRGPVLIEFWATWCPICASLLPRLEAAHRQWGSRVRFVVVGVAVNETRLSMRRHLAQHPQPFAFYFDSTGAAVRAYDAPATSYIVALDARGRVVYTGVGYDQDVEAAARKAAAP